jgi:hypothetical protein
VRVRARVTPVSMLDMKERMTGQNIRNFQNSFAIHFIIHSVHVSKTFVVYLHDAFYMFSILLL